MTNQYGKPGRLPTPATGAGIPHGAREACMQALPMPACCSFWCLLKNTSYFQIAQSALSGLRSTLSISVVAYELQGEMRPQAARRKGTFGGWENSELKKAVVSNNVVFVVSVVLRSFAVSSCRLSSCITWCLLSCDRSSFRLILVSWSSCVRSSFLAVPSVFCLSFRLVVLTFWLSFICRFISSSLLVVCRSSFRLILVIVTSRLSFLRPFLSRSLPSICCDFVISSRGRCMNKNG